MATSSAMLFVPEPRYSPCSCRACLAVDDDDADAHRARVAGAGAVGPDLDGAGRGRPARSGRCARARAPARAVAACALRGARARGRGSSPLPSSGSEVGEPRAVALGVGFAILHLSAPVGVQDRTPAVVGAHPNPLVLELHAYPRHPPHYRSHARRFSTCRGSRLRGRVPRRVLAHGRSRRDGAGPPRDAARARAPRRLARRDQAAREPGRREARRARQGRSPGEPRHRGAQAPHRPADPLCTQIDSLLVGFPEDARQRGELGLVLRAAHLDQARLVAYVRTTSSRRRATTS